MATTGVPSAPGAPVLLEVRDGVAHVTLNRPDHGNGLDLSLSRGLEDVFTRVAADDAARVVLLSGNGRFFCVGGDLKPMSETTDPYRDILEMANIAHAAIRALAALRKPVVTAVHNSSAGAGNALVLLSDFVLATPATSFVTAYTAVGLTPDCGVSWLLPRAIGTTRATDLMLDSRKLPAEEAQRIGLVTRVVEADELLDEALALARRLADGPAHALGQARHLIRASYGDGFDAHLDLEAETIARAAATAETQTLMASFFKPKA